MKKIQLSLIMLFLMALCATTVNAQVRNNNGVKNSKNTSKSGTWKILGTMHATHKADHDEMRVTGTHDYYRKLKLKVTDSPVNIKRMVVRYDDGAPEEINTRTEIPKGGESRVIDLRGGKRKLKSIEFWYDTSGFLNGKADVTVFGMK